MRQLTQLPGRAVAWVADMPTRLYVAVMSWLHHLESSRLDRGRMYVWVHVGLTLLGLGIAIKPAPSGVLSSLAADQDRGMAILILTGSVFCLIGSAMGSKRFLPTARVDVRIPYAFASFGQISVVSSLTIYTKYIVEYSDLVGTLAGALSICITGACMHITIVALKEIWAVTHLASHPTCPWWEQSREHDRRKHPPFVRPEQ